MAFRKRTVKKQARMSAHKKPFFKRPHIIAGMLLLVCGLALLVVALMPKSVGSAGAWLYDRILFELFGQASPLAGLYCLGLGAGLLFLKRKILWGTGLTCLLLPALVLANALFTQTSEDPLAPAVPSVKLGHLFGSVISHYIGTAGLTIVSLGIFLCGILLLTPGVVWIHLLEKIMASWRQRKSRSGQAASDSKAGKSASTRQSETPQKAPAVETLAASSSDIPSDVLRAQLNLAPYDQEFVKIPNGLFEEHTVFDRSLPVGAQRQAIIDAFASFSVDIEIGDIKRGPSFEQYEIIPGKGVKVAQIRSRGEDVSLLLKNRIHLGKMAGNSLVAEVPLQDRQVVPYGYLLEDTADDHMKIPVAVGVDASFSPFSVDLAELPHLLIAGTTGSGKSVFVKTLIASILYHLTPNEARLVLIDPKRVEFGVFASSLFCACDIITDFEDVPPVFNALVAEMEHRYSCLEKANVSDLNQYNASVPADQQLPYIVVVVDEFADLLMQNAEDFEQPAIRLAQKARACGIHLVLATQRPSADVIKGLLKTNIPGRIALSVSSKVDSKIILDTSGAENLTGKGDLICLCPAFRDGIRLQGAYITNEEIQKIMATKAKD
ncbi:MAG: DNA translocase FtsK [Planctomycetes bacterium]|nr:DNA translocase FtsK [Planctomycetota bacterium]